MPNPQSDLALAVDNLSLSLSGKPILKQLVLELSRGESLCLLGPSGCGKTTVLKCIAGLLTPDTGSIVVNGRLVAGKQSIPPQQRNIGFIFQDYALFPHMTVAENIGYGLSKLSKSDKAYRINECLQLVDLAGFGDRYPHQLSGGQQQRVALARALAPKPSVLLMDEPFSNIDAQLKRQMMAELKSIFKKANVSCIFVTHAKGEAFAFADKIAVMLEGNIAQFGRPMQLINQPASVAVAEFMECGNVLTAEQAKVLFPRLELTQTGSWLFKPEWIDIDSTEYGVRVKNIEQIFNGREYFVDITIDNDQLQSVKMVSQHLLTVGAIEKLVFRYNNTPYLIKE
ncbi:ABC transporter ATP-binding protein [Parashewanella curva]|uniref:ABC transporter ATP-binding protein n=1 Tax=Parashewanella curva TaxID=2338552 RepID=A0A3L8PRL1_9GAMM|nr:ABC transporter ATP-binding protein [Parashewanella curva]RLV58047.1 ABC transporter ATP-binding protein [Parashewanella curva]